MAYGVALCLLYCSILLLYPGAHIRIFPGAVDAFPLICMILIFVGVYQKTVIIFVLTDIPEISPTTPQERHHNMFLLRQPPRGGHQGPGGRDQGARTTGVRGKGGTLCFSVLVFSRYHPSIITILSKAPIDAHDTIIWYSSGITS